MVARLIEGWESSTAAADYAGKWTISGGTASITGSAGRFGNGLTNAHGSVATTAARVLGAQATWIVGLALRVPTLPGSASTILQLRDGGTTHCGLGVQGGTGLLFAWRGTAATVLGTASGGLSANAWAYVEVKATIHDTAGVFVIRLNGATVLDLSATDTRNAGNASADTITLVVPPATSPTHLDDLYVFDATGSANADFAGDCRVEQVLPTGAGATTAWTPSAGSNWQCVDEVPPTADTDYVSSSTAGQTDTYACGDLSVATSGTVKCVQASVLARKDDAGVRSLALVARPGSTDRVGATQALSTSYACYAQVWDTNPDTSGAWTVGETNSSQFGVQLIA